MECPQEIKSAGRLINRNMRCIEITAAAIHALRNMINRNMRCIEIWVEYGCAYGTIRLIET